MEDSKPVPINFTLLDGGFVRLDGEGRTKHVRFQTPSWALHADQAAALLGLPEGRYELWASS